MLFFLHYKYVDKVKEKLKLVKKILHLSLTVFINSLINKQHN